MLKRRREPSPAPAAPTSGSYAEPYGDFSVGAHYSTEADDVDGRLVAPMPRAKRRRTTAPVLDGSQRGWAIHPSMSSAAQEDDGEEDWVENADSQPETAAAHPHGHAPAVADYSSVNSFLHDLHQHRRNQSVQLSYTLATPQMAYSVLPHPVYQLPNYNSFMSRTMSPSHVEQHNAHIPVQSAYKVLPSGSGLPVPEIEMESVRNRYEETNRVLRELALKRRRGHDATPTG